MTDKRPVLLGMNNPLSDRPEHALYPVPDGCTGHRLWTMLNERTGATKTQYLRAFDRRNLIIGDWDPGEARLLGAEFVAKSDTVGRVVVVLGEGPRRALGLRKQLITPITLNGTIYRQIPHPSGRCRFYNDPVCRAVAALLLEELYETGRSNREQEEL